MNYIINLLRGEVLAEITGASTPEFLNLCAKKRLEFRDAEPVDGFTIRLRVNLKSLRELRYIARRCNCAVNIIHKRGAPVFLARFKKRYTLLAGLFVCVAALFWSTLFIWDIDVTGNENVTVSDILIALEKAGVGIGSFWPPFDNDRIRSRVIADVPELSFIAVNVYGSRAEVVVRERIPKPEIEDLSQPANIVALKSGIITGILTYRGSAVAGTGDTVLESEVIVSGEVVSPFAGLRLVRAYAEATARTWYNLTAVRPLETTVKVYTGGEKTRFALCLGKSRINIYSNSGICAGSCDKIVKENKLAIAGVFTLPVSLVRERYAEYELETSRLDANTARTELEEALYARLLDAVGDGKVVDSSFTAFEKDGLLYVTLLAECNELISGVSPIMP